MWAALASGTSRTHPRSTAHKILKKVFLVYAYKLLFVQKFLQSDFGGRHAFSTNGLVQFFGQFELENEWPLNILSPITAGAR